MAASPSKAGSAAQGQWRLPDNTDFSPATPPLATNLIHARVPRIIRVMSERNSILKERVRVFWQENPCGTKFADAPPGSRRFYELVEAHRYRKEWHIPAAAGFDQAKISPGWELVVGSGLTVGSFPN